MPPEPSPTSARTAAPGAAVLVEGYRVDSYEIPQPYAHTLREYVGSLARALRSRPGSSLTLNLVGHTDSTGSERHNTVLGINRALGVERAMQTLMPQDVAAQVRYASRSGGEYAPVSANTTARDRARNRRVEVRGVLSLPVAPKPKPRRHELPPLLSNPCLEFERAKAVFGAKYKILIDLVGATNMHFPDVGRPTLVPAARSGLVSASIDAVAKAILDKMSGTIQDRVFGSALSENLGAAYGQVETLAMLSQQQRWDEMQSNQRGPDAREMHRLLAAEAVAKAEGAHSWVARARELVELMANFERLSTDCARSRGTERGVGQRDVRVGPAPPGEVRRRPSD